MNNLKLRKDLHHIKRRRICDMIFKEPGPNIVLITAGAGAGKSSAVKVCLEDRDTEAIWITLTELDNSESFFYYHVYSLLEASNISQETGSDSKCFSSRQNDNYTEKDLAIILSDIRRKLHITIIFDNLHKIHNDSVLKTIMNLSAETYYNQRQILISRYDSGILRRWCEQLNGAVISGFDLRFSFDETRDFFRKNFRQVPISTAIHIHELTNGCPYLITLFYRGLAEYKQTTSLPPDLSSTHIYRIIEKWIWSLLTPEDQKCLIKLSYLKSFSKKMLSVLFSEAEIQAIFTGSLNHTIFYDEVVRMYRIHSVILDYLSNCQQNLTYTDVCIMYEKAAKILEEDNCLVEALGYYTYLNQYDKIWEIISQGQYYRQHQLNSQNVIDVIDQFPKLVLDEREEIHIVYAMNLINAGLYLKAKSYLEKYIHMCTTTKKHFSYYLGESYIFLGLISMIFGDISFVNHFKKASAYLPDGSRIINGKHMILLNGEALTLQIGAPDEINDWIQALEQAVPYFQHVLHGAASNIVHVARTEAAYYQGDMESAEKYAYEAIFKGREQSETDIVCNTYFTLCKVAYFKGKYERMEECVREAMKYYEMNNTEPNYILPEMMLAWLHIKNGNLHKISSWILDEETYLKNKMVNTSFCFERLIYAGYLLAVDKNSELLAFLESSEKVYRDRNQYILLIYIYILRAIALYNISEYELSEEALLTAYRMSYHNKIIMPFVENARYLRKIFEFLKNKENSLIDNGWLHEIYIKICTYRKQENILIQKYKQEKQQKETDLVLALRERQVLTFISQGMTREEIAAYLNLGVGTIKSTLNVIYEKLGAVNAPHAVAIALKSHLIE